MIIDYSSIKVIGFDLDQTLYPKSIEIDEAIQQYLYEKIAQKNKIPIQDAKKLFVENYAEIGSGSKTMMKVAGYKRIEAKKLVQTALAKADITKFLDPDPRTLVLIERLNNKYESVDLITGSDKKITLKKLRRLKLPTKLFNIVITADDYSKSDGEAYKKWMEYHREKNPQLRPQNFLYVGDRRVSDVEAPHELGIQAILVNQKKKNPKINALQYQSLNEIRKLLL